MLSHSRFPSQASQNSADLHASTLGPPPPEGSPGPPQPSHRSLFFRFGAQSPASPRLSLGLALDLAQLQGQALTGLVRGQTPALASQALLTLP